GAILGPDSAAVRLDEAARDRKAETAAAGRAGPIGPPEALEHAAERLGREPRSRVLDADQDVVESPLEVDRDRAVRGSVAKRVRQEVGEPALALLGCDARARLAVEVGDEVDLPR